MSRERNKEFDDLKVALLLANDFSGSDTEIAGIKQAILDYNSNPEVSERNKIDEEYLSFNKLYFSTNEKTGYGTVNFNISSSFNCFEAQNGFCKVQNQIYYAKDGRLEKRGKMACYGCRDEAKQPRKLQYSFINYICFRTLSIGEIWKQLEKYLDNHLEVDYLRFNENGCFYSSDSLQKASEIAKLANQRLFGTYSYTANKQLFLKYKNNQNIVLSFSNGNLKGCKNTKIINPNREAILKVLRSPDHVLCCSDCSNCSYCKDKDDLRTIVFVRHGMGIKSSVQKELTPDEYRRFKRLVKIENAKFEARFNIDCTFDSQ